MNNNLIHRALFSLPPIQSSTETALAVPELPPQQTVTGDTEVDAVIWLRQVIGTGQPALIAKAKEAAALIKTPLKELEKRYSAYLARTNAGNLFATFGAVGFADLDSWETTSIEMAARRQEAQSRFGDTLFSNTLAENFSEEALAGAKQGRDEFYLNNADVDARFDVLVDQRPATLADCLAELQFWNYLYWLRNAINRDWMDYSVQAQARKDYAFRCLGRIPPRSTEEAHQVLQYLIDDGAMDWEESPGILRNLMTQANASHAGGSDLLTRGKLNALELMQHRACALLEANGLPTQVEAAGALRSATADIWEAVDEQLVINGLPPALDGWMKTPAGLARVLIGALRKERIEESGEYNEAVEDCIAAVVGTISAGAKADLPASASGPVRPISPDLLQPKVSIEEVAELLGQLDELCDKDGEDELTALRRQALHVIGGLLAHAGAGVLA